MPIEELTIDYEGDFCGPTCSEWSIIDMCRYDEYVCNLFNEKLELVEVSKGWRRDKTRRCMRCLERFEE